MRKLVLLSCTLAAFVACGMDSNGGEDNAGKRDEGDCFYPDAAPWVPDGAIAYSVDAGCGSYDDASTDDVYPWYPDAPDSDALDIDAGVLPDAP